jgi:succinoglycan biosynthesis transport protein ExoP
MDPLKVTPPQETKLHFLDYWRIIRIRKTIILAVFLLVVITATLVTFILPESYSSTTRIKIERDQSDISGFAERNGNIASYDPYFIQTEFELIQSEVILGKVIEDLDLNAVWGKKYMNGERLKNSDTIGMLKGRIDLRPVRNTSLIEIRVYSEKADEAAGIANAIAEAYRAHRQAQRVQMSMGGIRALETRFAEQQEKVRQAQKRVDDLRMQLNIQNPLASGEAPLAIDQNSPVVMMTADTLRKLEALRIESKTEYVRQVALLDRLKVLGKDLGPEGVAQAIPTAAQDALLTALLQALSTAEQQLVTLSSDFGPSNSEVIKVKRQIEDLHSKIKSRVDGIMLGLETRVLSLSNSVDNLDQEVAKAINKDVERVNQTRPYFEAKRNLEELQRFHAILNVKLASENIQVAQPNMAMVDIIDRATPAIRPASPRTGIGLALITLGVLLDIAGLMLVGSSLGGGPDPRPVQPLPRA